MAKFSPPFFDDRRCQKIFFTTDGDPTTTCRENAPLSGELKIATTRYATCWCSVLVGFFPVGIYLNPHLTSSEAFSRQVCKVKKGLKTPPHLLIKGSLKRFLSKN